MITVQHKEGPMDIKLTQAESEIMNYFWAQKEGVTFGEVLNFFQNEGERGWKKQTLNTYLRKLIAKGLIVTQRKGTRLYYSASVGKEKFGTLKSREVIDKYYDGSTARFFAAFSASNSLTQAEAQELLNMLKER